MWVVSLLLPAIPVMIDAQVITGTLRDSVSNAPLAGVLVSAGIGGSRGVTALSDERGRFTMRLPHPGEWEVTARRLGLRPSPVRRATVGAGERVQIDLRLEPVAMALAAIGVRERSICGRGDTSSTASRQLLVEFMTALQSLSASSRSGHLRATVTSYVQYLDPTTGVVLADTTRRDAGFYRLPFASVTPGDIAASGFVRVTSEGEVVYVAPDPEVLASPLFLEAHCFRAALLSGEPGVVGLFISTRPGTRNPDIEGVARFDSVSLALRQLDFVYVRTPAEAGVVQASARIDVSRLSAGAWWVSAWHITAPAYSRAAELPSRQATRAHVLRRAGGFVHGPGLPVRSGSLELTGSFDPGDSVIAVLSGTGRVARRSTSGGLSLGDITPGRYRVVVSRASQRTMPGAIAVDTVTVASGASTRRGIRWAEEAYGTPLHWCGTGGRAESRGAVFVLLLDSAGAHARSERDVTLLGARQANVSVDGFRRESFRQPARTDAAGVAWMCDREEHEEFTLVDGLELRGAVRVPVGRIAARRFLVRHVRIGAPGR